MFNLGVGSRSPETRETGGNFPLRRRLRWAWRLEECRKARIAFITGLAGAIGANFSDFFLEWGEWLLEWAGAIRW